MHFNAPYNKEYLRDYLNRGPFSKMIFLYLENHTLSKYFYVKINEVISTIFKMNFEKSLGKTSFN